MPYRILVVEDEPDDRAMIAEVLSLDEHEVDSATDSAQALRLLDEQSYNLVVSDLRMPGLDGRELYRVLLQRYGADLPRVIFMTGHGYEPHYADLLFRTGEPVLTKPFDRKQLRDLVAQVLQT
jgi:CheY-like chemotaxis protein